MGNIGWVIVFVGTGLCLGLFAAWRLLRVKESEYKVQGKRNSGQGLVALGGTFVVLGIAIGASTDRFAGYPFIGAGVLLSVIGAIKSRRKEQRSSMAMR